MPKARNAGRRANGRIHRIAISTGGGDAPGLNAVIRSVVLAAHNRGWDVEGIRDGYNGVMLPDQYRDGGLIHLTPEKVSGITHLGGTIIGTTNVGNPLHFPVRQPNGKTIEVDRTDDLVRALEANGIDAVVAVGGDGSLTIANALAKKGVRIVGVPKTIDNDLSRTVVTFGFDTAVSFATECIDRLHSTAAAHRRVIVVEVMGRYSGWIALNSGISATADVILIPEIPYDMASVKEKIAERYSQGRGFAMVVVAEGAREKGGAVSVVEKKAGSAERLGGAGEKAAEAIRAATGRDTRLVVLGHLLRGGSPTTFDRLISLRFGAAAVRALAGGRTGVMVALDPPTVRYVPLAEATERMKTVPLDCDTVLTARELGICLGD
jgi:phosphofructokinase-like protein